MTHKLFILGGLLAALCLMGCEDKPTVKTTPDKSTEDKAPQKDKKDKKDPKEAPKATPKAIKGPDATPSKMEKAAEPEKGELADNRCLKEEGCPAAQEIPKCAADMKTMPMSKGLDKRNPIKTGTKVSLVGPLKHGTACTERACPPEVCCNSCTGSIGLGPEGFAASGEYTVLALMDDKDPKRFICEGDNSLICCPYEAKGQQVVVTGEFAIIKGSYGIKNPTLCIP